MKKLHLFLLTFLLVANQNFAQNPVWSLPNNYYPFGGVSPLPILMNSYTSTHNAYPKPDGSLGFYVVDDYVYDGSGQFIAAFYDSSVDTIKGQTEIAIVPSSSNCNDVFIFTGGSTGHGADGYKIFAIGVRYNASSNIKFSPILDPATSNYMVNVTDIINSAFPTLNFNNVFTHKHPIYFAVNPDIINGKRYVYLANSNSIVKLSVSNTPTPNNPIGIVAESYFTTNGLGLGNMNNRSEMELVRLGSGGYRIALPPYIIPNSNDSSRVIGFFDLDSNGDYISSSFRYCIINKYLLSSISGMEFSPNGRYLYFNSESAAHGVGYFNYIDLNDSILTPYPLALSTNSDFGKSFIELGIDGKLYFAHSGGLATYTNPNSPGTGVFTPNAVLASYSLTKNRYILPDQIDGFDYMGHYINNIQCCIQNSTYDKWEYKSISGSYTWEPGSNPITSTTSNTVYIRDSLVINLNSNITIKNMTFVFAPDAQVVVHGGVVGQQGGKLTLDNSTFTVDTSCAKKMWNGIKVLGNPSYAQGTVSNSIQGWVVLKNNSKIMHARVGIDAGNYVSMNTSTRTGGVVQATNASFINNKMGVRLLHYNSPSGNGNAAHKFTDTRFLTNGILIESAIPQHLQLFGVKGVNIMGCSFENQTPNLYVQEQKGHGIYSYNSSFQVNQRCTSYTQPAGYPCYGIPTVFKNLQTGVFAQSTSLHHTHIHESLFENNAQGIAVHGNANPHIVGNDFFVLKDPNYNSYGLYLYNTPALTVEENFFTEFGNSGDPSGGSSYGVIVYNSGKNKNTVYRNTFKNIKVGAQAQGINGTHTPTSPDSGTIGLQFICNTFLDDKIYQADIAVSSGRIAHLQGLDFDIITDPNQLHRAGNLFSSSSFTTQNNYWINPGVDQNIDYSNHLPNATYRTEPVLRTLGRVMVNPGTTYYDPSIHCKTKAYKPIKPGVIGAIVMKSDSVKSELSKLKMEFDGGNTADYLALLAQQNWEEVLNSAMEYAPMISEKVLLGLIAANADISELEPFLEACSPLSNQVRQAYLEAYGLSDLGNLEHLQEGYTEAARQQLYYKISILENEIEDLYKSALAIAATDSIDNYESLLLLIGDANDEKSQLRRIQLHLSEGNYTAVAEELAQIEGESILKSFYSFLLPYYSAPDFKAAIEVDPDYFFENLNQYYASESSISAFAYSLYLTYAEGGAYVDTIEPLYENPSPKNKKADEIAESESGKINIYPNPAHNKIYINGLSADTNYAVRIMDINGKIWLQTELSKDGSLNISGLKSGLYVIQIQSDREIMRTQSIVKIE